MAANNIQVLDVAGLNLLVGKLKDGSLIIGKANEVPASGINGEIPLSALPKAALERVTVVADEAARLALKAEQVQNGDTVQVTATKKMYFVVDDTKLGSEAGFKEYVVGTAAKAALADAVPWSGVTGKPATFPAETHTHTAAEAGVEAIPDSVIESIINGTYTG